MQRLRVIVGLVAVVLMLAGVWRMLGPLTFDNGSCGAVALLTWLDPETTEASREVREFCEAHARDRSVGGLLTILLAGAGWIAGLAIIGHYEQVQSAARFE